MNLQDSTSGPTAESTLPTWRKVSAGRYVDDQGHEVGWATETSSMWYLLCGGVRVVRNRWSPCYPTMGAAKAARNVHECAAASSASGGS